MVTKNSKFFHVSASMRRRKNHIPYIEHQGNIVKDSRQLRKIFIQHFKELFGNTSEASLDADWRAPFCEEVSDSNDPGCSFLDEVVKMTTLALQGTKPKGQRVFRHHFSHVIGK